MINSSMLKKLNDIAFGADIDSLESYMVDYKQAQMIAKLDRYNYNYLEMNRILKELKPDSLAFSSKTALEPCKQPDDDELMEVCPPSDLDVIYDRVSDKLDDLRAILEKGDKDLVAIPYVEGIRVSVIYKFGFLHRIYADGYYSRYINLTLKIRGLAKEYIEEFEDYDTVELRGKLTIYNSDTELQKRDLNTICSTMRCLRSKYGLDKLHIVYDNMVALLDGGDSDNSPYNNNQWDKLEYLNSIGLETVHHALVRNIHSDVLSQALVELDDYFDDDENTGGINYDYKGIEIRLNEPNRPINSVYDFIYSSRDCDASQLFESTVKSITTINEKGHIENYINFVEIECNKKCLISSIKISDVYDLEELGIHIGKKIRFNVVEGKALLYKN